MKDEAKKLDDVLNDFLKQNSMEKGVLQVRIVNFWKEMMGDVVDKYTDKIFLKNKSLFVSVSVSALKNELLYSKDTIIQRIEEEFGEGVVNEIVLL